MRTSSNNWECTLWRIEELVVIWSGHTKYNTKLRMLIQTCSSPCRPQSTRMVPGKQSQSLRMVQVRHHHWVYWKAVADSNSDLTSFLNELWTLGTRFQHRSKILNLLTLSRTITTSYTSTQQNIAEKEDENLMANESPKMDDSLIWLDEDGNLNRNDNALIADS